MTSNSKVTKGIRIRKERKRGKERKRQAKKGTTPPFPIHVPERHGEQS